MIEDINKVLHIAIRRIRSVPTGDVFILRDVFTGIEWKNFDKGFRNAFGRYFLQYARRSKLIEVTEKNKAKHQLYRKT